jgi:hypothetical protein
MKEVSVVWWCPLYCGVRCMVVSVVWWCPLYGGVRCIEVSVVLRCPLCGGVRFPLFGGVRFISIHCCYLTFLIFSHLRCCTGRLWACISFHVSMFER